MASQEYSRARWLGLRVWSGQEDNRVNSCNHWRETTEEHVCGAASTVGLYGWCSASKEKKGEHSCMGMVSDSLNFIFACLNENQKFLISPTLQWWINHEDILQHIDMILLNAINSSPYITPVKSSNPALRGYRPYLKGSWQFGDESDEDMEEEPVELVDVIKQDGDVYTIETGVAF